jgi:hypothetical protein
LIVNVKALDLLDLGRLNRIKGIGVVSGYGFFHGLLNGVEGHGAFQELTVFCNDFLIFELQFEAFSDFVHQGVDSGKVGIMVGVARLGHSDFSLHVTILKL